MSLNQADVSVPKVKMTENKETLKRELIRQKNVGRICMQTVRSRTSFEPEHYIMGSISCISTAIVGEHPSHYCLIASVFEKTDTPAMVKHDMSLVQAIKACLNQDQIPVLACDQPLFAQ